MAPILGYWNIRAFAQPIRLLLAHAGVEYEEKRYLWIGDNNEWLPEKFQLGLAFPNLPYYIDGEVKLSQTMTILRYLARKHGMIPQTEEEIMRVDQVEFEALDIRSRFVNVCYSPDFDKIRGEFVESFIRKCKQLAEFLGDRAYFAGQRLTYVDFLVYELVEIHLIMAPEALDGLDNLKAFQERVASLDKVAAYIKSDRFIGYPLTGPTSFFGGK